MWYNTAGRPSRHVNVWPFLYTIPVVRACTRHKAKSRRTVCPPSNGGDHRGRSKRGLGAEAHQFSAACMPFAHMARSFISPPGGVLTRPTRWRVEANKHSSPRTFRCSVDYSAVIPMVTKRLLDVVYIKPKAKWVQGSFYRDLKHCQRQCVSHLDGETDTASGLTCRCRCQRNDTIAG